MLLAFSRSAEPSRSTRSSSGAATKSPADIDVLEGIPESPATVAEAYECLTQVSSRLRAKGDPRAAFTDVYAVITRRVRDAIHGEAESPFIEPDFISRLAGRFCALYLAALRRSLAEHPEPSRAWAAADRCKESASTLPLQHALLGLNAHINYDLALGLLENVQALGDAGDPATMARYEHDHDAVNRILEEAMPEAVTLLAERYGCRVAHAVLRAGELRPVLYGATLFTLRVWRSRVWRDLCEMLAARDERARGAILARMNARSGVIATLLSLPIVAPAANVAGQLFAAA